MARSKADRVVEIQHHRAAGRFVVHIRFKIAEEALAFAKHFAGRVL
jgi:hypothetical protein